MEADDWMWRCVAPLTGKRDWLLTQLTRNHSLQSISSLAFALPGVSCGELDVIDSSPVTTELSVFATGRIAPDWAARSVSAGFIKCNLPSGGLSPGKSVKLHCWWLGRLPPALAQSTAARINHHSVKCALCADDVCWLGHLFY